MDRTYLIVSRPRCIAAVSLMLTWVCFAAQSSTGVERKNESDVEKVERLLSELQENHAAGNVSASTYSVSEDELNAYLLAQLHKQARKGVERISVRLNDGSFVTLVEVDMDELELKDDSQTGNLFTALLSGRQSLELEGELRVENGLGTYRLEQARLNGFPFPAAIVNSLLSSYGQKQDSPFDPTQPFEMPYGIKSVTFQPGRLIVQTE